MENEKNEEKEEYDGYSEKRMKERKTLYHNIISYNKSTISCVKQVLEHDEKIHALLTKLPVLDLSLRDIVRARGNRYD